MGKANTSKFIREYGATLQQLAKKYKLSTTYLRMLDIQGELHNFIEEQAAKQKVESNIEEGIERSRKLADEILERHQK